MRNTIINYEIDCTKEYSRRDINVLKERILKLFIDGKLKIDTYKEQCLSSDFIIESFLNVFCLRDEDYSNTLYWNQTNLLNYNKTGLTSGDISYFIALETITYVENLINKLKIKALKISFLDSPHSGPITSYTINIIEKSWPISSFSIKEIGNCCGAAIIYDIRHIDTKYYDLFKRLIDASGYSYFEYINEQDSIPDIIKHLKFKKIISFDNSRGSKNLSIYSKKQHVKLKIIEK